MSPSSLVPPELLKTFVSECVTSLQTCQLQASSISQLRQKLVQLQLDCLAQVVASYNDSSPTHKSITVQQVQSTLQQVPTSLQYHTQLIDQAARIAFARLVLFSFHPPVPSTSSFSSQQLQQLQQQQQSKKQLERSDFLEFCGLCMAAVQLPDIQQYLAFGTIEKNDDCQSEVAFLTTVTTTPAAASLSSSSTYILPQERLERIQEHIFRALSYDIEIAKAELKRLFLKQNHHHHPPKNEFTNDTIVQRTYAQFMSSMRKAIMEATHQAQEQAFTTKASPTAAQKQDHASTRVVAVEYSETMIDATTGETLDISVPSSSHIPCNQAIHTNMPLAVTQLQQELWAELLAMRDEEREKVLQKAAMLASQVQEKVVQLVDENERKQYLQSMDWSTQKQLVLHKMWQSWIQHPNGGIEPVIRYHSIK